MTSRAARAAAVYGALTVSHEFADYWGQPDALATRKGNPGLPGAAACAGHVALYTAAQAGALYAANRFLGLGLRPRRAATALAVSAVTHYVADRQGGRWQDKPEEARSLVRLAQRTGKEEWLQRDPGAGASLDQSWHKTWIGIAATIAA
jgi:hypothetical protein